MSFRLEIDKEGAGWIKEWFQQDVRMLLVISADSYEVIVDWFLEARSRTLRRELD